MSPPALFFFKIILEILGPLNFHVNFEICLSVSAKNTKQNKKSSFDFYCIESVDQFGGCCHLNTVQVSDP